MSKGLEALEYIKKSKYDDCAYIADFASLEIIEKELKALEIINEKDVNIGAFRELDLEHYNMYARDILGTRQLTKEEYDLLKEII